MKTLFPWIVLLSLTLTACATADRGLTAEAKKEPIMTTPSSLNEHVRGIIEGDSALSPDKKATLIGIVDKTSAENTETQILINQKSSLLLKELLSDPYHPKNVSFLKKSLVKLNEKKLSNSLQALEQIKEVLGHYKDREILFNKMLQLGGRN